LAEANRNLAYLKEFSENIIESVPLGIVTLDSQGLVRSWNTEMEKLASLNRREAINRPVRRLLPWIPVSAWAVGNQPELSAQSPAGLAIKLTIVPFEDPSGGLVAILDNVSAKKQMEEQLLQSSKLASLGKFTAGISHEIGNPLASISSLIQELQAIDLSDPREGYFTGEALTTIGKHVTRIAKIVRGLGDFARISAIERTPTDIVALLQQTIDLAKFDKRSRAIDFVLEADPMAPLDVNPDQIQQVFFNILINAVDAMPDGGRLEIGARCDPPWVVLAFADTGRGIDAEIIDRIFDPFFTTKPHSKGTGLGLSLCYGIIKDHHGHISVNSQKGRGTVFEVRLPMQVSDE
jgi:signal transduction histidine kinase